MSHSRRNSSQKFVKTTKKFFQGTRADFSETIVDADDNAVDISLTLCPIPMQLKCTRCQPITQPFLLRLLAEQIFESSNPPEGQSSEALCKHLTRMLFLSQNIWPDDAVSPTVHVTTDFWICEEIFRKSWKVCQKNKNIIVWLRRKKETWSFTFDGRWCFFSVLH